MEAIRSMHADFYDLPDNTRFYTSSDSSSKSKILEEEVTINDCEQSLQTISPILSWSRRTGGGSGPTTSIRNAG
jgi:hypothetical protein